MDDKLWQGYLQQMKQLMLNKENAHTIQRLQGLPYSSQRRDTLSQTFKKECDQLMVKTLTWTMQEPTQIPAFVTKVIQTVALLTLLHLQVDPEYKKGDAKSHCQLAIKNLGKHIVPLFPHLTFVILADYRPSGTPHMTSGTIWDAKRGKTLHMRVEHGDNMATLLYIYALIQSSQ